MIDENHLNRGNYLGDNSKLSSAEETLRKNRAKKLKMASYAAIIAKMLAVLTPLITVRISFSYLGEEIYGLWSAATSFFALFSYADLGLGSGLATKLGHASGSMSSSSRCKQLISSTYAILAPFSLLLLVIFVVLFPFLNWASILNVVSADAIAMVGSIVFAVVLPKIISIPFALVQRIQISLQDGFNSYLWQAFGSILGLTSILVVYALKLGSLAMIWASSCITLVVLVLNTLFYFWIKKREIKPDFKSVQKEDSIEVLKMGIDYFLLSILTNLGLSLDTFIVGFSNSYIDAASYSIIFKIVQTVAAVCTLISSNLWGANAEAMSRGDYAWVASNTKRMSLLFFAVTGSLSLVMVVFINPVAAFVVGKSLNFSLSLIIGTCLVQILQAVISPHFMVLNALGMARVQILIYGLYTPISLVLKYLACSIYGQVGVPWAGAICYLLIIYPAVLFCEKRVYAARL